MYKISEIIELANIKLKTTTDYQLSKKLGLANQTKISDLKKRKANPSDEFMLTLAKAVDLSPEYLIACVKVEIYESKKNEELIQIWSNIANAFKPK